MLHWANGDRQFFVPESNSLPPKDQIMYRVGGDLEGNHPPGTIVQFHLSVIAWYEQKRIVYIEVR